MKVRMTVSGVDVELGEDVTIATTIKASEIGELGTGKVSHTNTFKVPATPANVATFQQLGVIGDDGGFSRQLNQEVNVYSDGLPVIEGGRLDIDKVTIATDGKMSYNVSIIGGVKSIEDILEGVTLNSMDVAGGDHFLNQSSGDRTTPYTYVNGVFFEGDEARIASDFFFKVVNGTPTLHQQQAYSTHRRRPLWSVSWLLDRVVERLRDRGVKIAYSEIRNDPDLDEEYITGALPDVCTAENLETVVNTGYHYYMRIFFQRTQSLVGIDNSKLSTTTPFVISGAFDQQPRSETTVTIFSCDGEGARKVPVEPYGDPPNYTNGPRPNVNIKTSAVISGSTRPVGAITIEDSEVALAQVRMVFGTSGAPTYPPVMYLSIWTPTLRLGSFRVESSSIDRSTGVLYLPVGYVNFIGDPGANTGFEYRLHLPPSHPGGGFNFDIRNITTRFFPMQGFVRDQGLQIRASESLPAIPAVDFLKDILVRYCGLLSVNSSGARMAKFQEIASDVQSSAVDMSAKFASIKDISYKVAKGVAQQNVVGFDNDPDSDTAELRAELQKRYTGQYPDFVGALSSFTFTVSDATAEVGPKGFQKFELFSHLTEVIKYLSLTDRTSYDPATDTITVNVSGTLFFGYPASEDVYICQVGSSLTRFEREVVTGSSAASVGADEILIKLGNFNELPLVDVHTSLIDDDAKFSAWMGQAENEPWNSTLGREVGPLMPRITTKPKYERYIQMLNKSVVMTVQMALTPVDVREVDTLTPVYIKQLGSYFLIQEIKNYKGGTLTDVVLVRLPDQSVK